MRVNTISKTNFGASIKIDNKYSEMIKYSPLKQMKNSLEKSGTHNVYELGSYKQFYKKSGSHDLFLNGTKFDEISTSVSDGYFGTAKKFLQKSLDKENSILAEINPEISDKLNKIRDYVKNTGLSIENVKKWL